MEIKRDTTIEEIVEDNPKAVKYLMENGIHCIVCGEPVWGTIEEVAEDKDFSDKEIDKIIRDLNKLN